MLIITDQIDEVRSRVAEARRRGLQIGCVPTMGALHAGHVALIQRARMDCGFVVVTIFVNPTQFAPGEDYHRYPRSLAEDHEVCRRQGVDLVFEPPAGAMYPGDEKTTVHVSGLSEHLCGPHRPGHFDGVCTVVAKLLNITQPDAAYFGEKDAQQLAVVTRMCRDLNMPVRIVPCATVRETDGVAMSSRNAFLTHAERAQATCLYGALQSGKAAIEAGQRGAGKVEALMRQTIEAAGPCRIDYVTIVDRRTFQPVDRVNGPVVMALAVRIGNTRLIDNIAVDASVAAG